VPHTPEASKGFHDDQLPALHGLLAEYLQAMRLQVDVACLHTPMALPLAKAVKPACMVYNCMDELAAFQDAPRQLRQRESALLKIAAFVLTGGASLHQSRRQPNRQVVYLLSAVDAAHYLVSQHDWSRSADSVHELLAGALYVARVQANPTCVPDDSKSEAPKFASAGGLQGNDTPSFWKDRSPPGTRVRRLPHWCVSPSLRTENPRTHT